ncbi:MAG: homocysteine S-methyltransferase family protein [Coriobacteriales bacterium]|jgi:5-methyltetrahydrofolate--homocysteine methyltransferase|nr:homocysteine S-methyltransferase family protein [Coriobacteriales bacterium]
MIDIAKLTTSRVLLFDGAMGTMLQQGGLAPDVLPELLNLNAPETISDIHSQYVQAGADVVTTNTFQANGFKLGDAADVAQVVAAGVACAQRSHAAYVALDIGPLGQFLEPLGELSFEQAYDAFKVQLVAGERAGADLVIIETFSDPQEAKAAIFAARENTQLPIICTLTFEENGRTLMGYDPLTAVEALQDEGIAAFGINCSVGPRAMQPIVEVMLRQCRLPVVMQANAGLPSLVDGHIEYEIGPEEYAQAVIEMVQRGVAIIGGCCGTTPEYIRLLKQKLGVR